MFNTKCLTDFDRHGRLPLVDAILNLERNTRGAALSPVILAHTPVTMAAIASLNVNALFGKKAPAKKAPAKKGPAKKGPAKKSPVRSAGTRRQGNVGPNRTLWNGWESNPEPPAYLDGSLPGDAGFDPFGLSKPVEYLQFDLDSLDGSAAVNPIGQVIGKLKKVDNAPTERTIVVRTTRVSASSGRSRCVFRATRRDRKPAREPRVANIQMPVTREADAASGVLVDMWLGSGVFANARAPSPRLRAASPSRFSTQPGTTRLSRRDSLVFGTPRRRRSPVDGRLDRNDDSTLTPRNPLLGSPP